jgi:hypothetical protein
MLTNAWDVLHRRKVVELAEIVWLERHSDTPKGL